MTILFHIYSGAITKYGKNLFVIEHSFILKSYFVFVKSVKNCSIKKSLGWGAEDFSKIMEILDKHNVKTTFFMTGEWVEKYPECVKTLVEKGHDLGNHSATHPDMTTLSKEAQKEQILNVHNAVKELTGYEMELFRPPYGAYNNEVIRTCYEVGYYPIQWDVDTLVIEKRLGS